MRATYAFAVETAKLPLATFCFSWQLTAHSPQPGSPLPGFWVLAGHGNLTSQLPEGAPTGFAFAFALRTQKKKAVKPKAESRKGKPLASGTTRRPFLLPTAHREAISGREQELNSLDQEATPGRRNVFRRSVRCSKPKL
jgi:hypothetical protein